MQKIVGIIDDDQLYQFVTKRIIEKNSNVKSVLQFYNGEEGINYLKDHLLSIEELPDIILLDINMPYLNGWQFLDEFMGLNIENYKPVIYIVSSSANTNDLKKASSYPVLQGYQVKPITREIFDNLLIA